jgi:hypothetical protein
MCVGKTTALRPLPCALAGRALRAARARSRAMRLLRALALAACLAAACAPRGAAAKRAPSPPRKTPPANASSCPLLRTEHVHHFEHACLHGGAEPPHSGARPAK